MLLLAVSGSNSDDAGYLDLCAYRNLDLDDRQSINIAMYRPPESLSVLNSTMEGVRESHGDTARM